MPTITVFKAQSDKGQDLLDNYIAPACIRIGARVKEAPAGSSPSYAMRVQLTSDLVLWDCSWEGDDSVYKSLNNWVKTTRSHLILSRTSLPRNVLSYFQCAPIHGVEFPNEALGEWLDRQLPLIIQGKYSHEAYQNESLARHYWMFEKPADFFLSFRGSRLTAAQSWKETFESELSVKVRTVPANELSYPTECVSGQQMWEGVARLMHEIKAIRRPVVFMSKDYFDSFWTSSEFLITIWMFGKHPITRQQILSEAYFAQNDKSPYLDNFWDRHSELGVPEVEQGGMDRFAKLINNSDPVTSAPETRIPARGPAKLIAWLLGKRMGYYDSEFLTEHFWEAVRVPCPICKPKCRSANEVDWNRHMSVDCSSGTDYFGYFVAQPSELASGRVTCPSCTSKLDLENKRGVRTLWVPIMSTEKDKSRPVIEQRKVWEVVEPNRLIGEQAEAGSVQGGNNISRE